MSAPDNAKVAARLGDESSLPGEPADFSARPRRRAGARPRVVITPERRWYDLGAVELWRHRDLLFFLAQRDVKLRYRQTLLGAAWAVIQPLFPMLVFTVVFTRFMRVPVDEASYPVFVYAGLLVWTYFSGAVANAGNSFVANSHMVSKVYFPRLLLPLAPILSGLVDLVIASGLLVLLMLYYGVAPSPYALLLPLLVVLAGLLALAVGTIMAALGIVYRDARYAFPLLLNVWMFLTPVIYPARAVPEKWRWLVLLNPLTGVVENARALLFGTDFDAPALVASIAVTLLLLACAGVVFARTEKYLADFV